MPDLLANWWRWPVAVERYAGSGSYGPTYAAATTAMAWIDDKRRMVRNADGDQVVSETSVYLPITTPAIPTGSKVTLPPQFGDRVVTVLAASRHDGNGLPTPDHLELALT